MKDVADIKDQIREEQKRKNREQMPEIAKLMDQINARFPGSKLIWAKDLTTGKEIGKKSEEKNLFLLRPANLLLGCLDLVHDLLHSLRAWERYDLTKHTHHCLLPPPRVSDVLEWYPNKTAIASVGFNEHSLRMLAPTKPILFVSVDWGAVFAMLDCYCFPEVGRTAMHECNHVL